MDAASYQVAENLMSNNLDHVERYAGAHRVQNHVTMNADEMLRVEDAVFVLQQSTPLINQAADGQDAMKH